MAALHLVATGGFMALADAGLPQAAALSDSSCQFGHLSAIVHAGRTQAVCTSRRGSACCTALQEHRSRECRAPRSFCRCAWLPSWQLAPLRRKKSSTLTHRLLSNRPTPANTSKTKGRAPRAALAQPALFLSAVSAAPRPWANKCICISEGFVIRRGTGYAEGLVTFFSWRFSCGRPPSLPFWPLPPSPPALSPRPSPSRCPSPSSLRRPASTAPDFPERARRGNRPAPVPTPKRAPQHEVRPC